MSAVPQSEIQALPIDDVQTSSPEKPVLSDGNSIDKSPSTDDEADDANVNKAGRRKGLGPVALIFACGAALFSDGYVNASSGPVNTIISAMAEKNQYKVSDDQIASFSKDFTSLAFAGTLVGMLVFGVLSDRIGRKFGMIFASLWMTLFSVLISGAWGAGGSTLGMFAALEAYRFLLGIAIGAEYPAGSVACSENTEAKDVNPRRQQMYFIIATNSMIDIGFVAATLVAFILYNIFGENHLVWVWRLTLGLGAIPPLVVLFFRVKMQEPERYRQGAIKKNVPWMLILRKYWLRLTAVCISWFIYDWVSYPAGLYSSYFVKQLNPSGGLFQSLGYSVLINAFYLPGTIIGALVSDRLGPKNTMILGLLCQCAFGFGLAGGFGDLRNNLPGIIILYGIYVAFGEFGPGNNLGLLASKAVAPSAVRGTFYGIAAAIGKVGAFTGTYVYTEIQNDLAGGDDTKDLYYSGPFYIGSALAIVSAACVFFFVPPVTENGMTKMDEEFHAYLAEHGYDMSNVGLLDQRAEDTTEKGRSSKESS